MSKSPVECKCSSCECGIYTYNESQVCARCEENKHSSGQKRWSTMVLKTESPSCPVKSSGTLNVDTS